MNIKDFTRLRELASAARVEWHVADPVTKAYCISFDRSTSLNPEQDAHDWLADHRKRFPDSRHAKFEVMRVEVRSELQRLAGELADAYAALPVQRDTPAPAANGGYPALPSPDYHWHHEDACGDAVAPPAPSFSTATMQAYVDTDRANRAPDLENLQDRLLTPTTIDRDSLGHWYHPHLPDCDEGISYGDLLAVFGMEVTSVGMDGDAPEDVAKRYFEQGGPDCSDWTPTPPEGDGWALLAIFDTEDGPHALFARKAPEPRPLSLRAATEKARKMEAAYFKEAARAVAFSDIIENHTHAMQAAVIEAHLGKGTATAMAWIVNTLRGPGHLPDLDAAAKLDDPQGKGKAQVWFDLMETQHSAFRKAHPAPMAPKGGA